MITYDLSDKSARFLIRGYFDGSGQHWIRVWDRDAGTYLPGYHRSYDAAESEAQAKSPAMAYRVEIRDNGVDWVPVGIVDSRDAADEITKLYRYYFPYRVVELPAVSVETVS